MAHRRVLVTGATSGLGTALVAALKSRGENVVAYVRPTSTTDTLYRLGATLIEGDVTDAVGIARAVRGCDAVVHAIVASGAGKRKDLERVYVAGTHNVARAARAEGARMVHVSSASVYGRHASGVVTEETTVQRSGLTDLDAKIAAEQAVLEQVHNEGLWAAIVRPPLIYGPYDRTFLPSLAALLRRRAFVYTIDPTTRINLVHVQHLVEVILAVFEHGHAAGEAFNVCDGEPISLGQVVRVVCRYVGASVPRLYIPAPAVHRAAAALQAAFAARGDRESVTGTWYALQIPARDYTLSIDKARKMLGWKPTIATVQGIAQACEGLA